METTNLWSAYAKKHVLITTDLETDDLVALQLLSKLIPIDTNVSFVVGEGNATMKYHRMKKYVELMGFHGPNNQSSTVYQGSDSWSDFTFDGEDVFSISTCKELRKHKRDNKKDMDELKQFLETNECMIIMLKPPREFIEYWKSNNKLFNKVTMFAYMSFNIKCLFDIPTVDLIS